MIYELKKLIRRKEVWIVLGLSVIAILLLVFRDPAEPFAMLRANSRKTAAYYNMPLEEAVPAIERELEQLGPAAADVSSAHYWEWRVLNSMQQLAQTYQDYQKNAPEVIRRMYADLEHARSDYARRDLAHAIRLYNRARPYRLTSVFNMEFFVLQLEYGNYFHYLFILILCTLLSPLFTAEHESGMYQILFASKRGKAGLFRKKICGGILCASLFAFVYTAFSFMLIWFRRGMYIRMLFAPIQCTELFRDCPYAISFLDYALLLAAMRAVIGAFVIALVALASCFFRKTIAVFAVSGGIASVPLLIDALFSHDPAVQLALKRLGLMRLTYLRDYFTEYDTVNVCGYPVGQFLLSVLCTVLLTAFLLSAAYVLYTKKLTRSGKQVKSCSASKN